MFKELAYKVKNIFTKEEVVEAKGQYIDFTADDEIAIGDEVEEFKMCNSYKYFRTAEEKKRERLHAICSRTRKFRVKKKLIKRIVDSFEKEGFFDD